MREKLMLLLACFIFAVGTVTAQTSNVTGTVISEEDGQPVVGASVLVVGTQLGTVTDVNGKFALSGLPKSAKNLQVSYIGMMTETVAIKSNVKVVLKSDSKALDEVMVVAYGTAKKSAFTGSAASVGAEKISQRVVSNVSNALTGQVAGVQTTSTNGQPGKSATIRIRGIGSLSSSNAPLYVVDGVPYDGELSNINPNDIQSMSVLKDASANAIYGARGANGVILITTKDGKNGEAKINFDAKWGSNSRCVPQYKVLGAAEYYETMYKALYNSQFYNGASAADSHNYARKNLLDSKNGGLGYQVFTVPEGEYLVGENFKLNPNATAGYSDGTYYYQPTDWYDELFGNNFRQEYNFNVSGKNGNLSYYASLGYLNDSGLIKNSAFTRYSGRAKVDYQAKKFFKMGTNLSYSHSDSQSPDGQDGDDWGSSGNLFYVANTIAPIYPIYVRNADGSIKINNAVGKAVYDDGKNTGFSRPGFVGNAARDIDYNQYHNYIDNFTGKFYAVLTPVEGLNITANVGVNVQNSRDTELYSTFGSSSSTDGLAYVEHERKIGVNSQLLAEYSHTFADKHDFNILAGYEQYSLKDQVFYAENDHLYDPFIAEMSNAVGSDSKLIKSYTDNYVTKGILTRVQYNYDGKYFLNASYRRDASSRFAPDHRWGNFGSVGAAWLITKEGFLSDIKGVDMLKLKASWGVQGNDHLLKDVIKEEENYYAYLDQYDVTYSNGMYATNLKYKGNKELTWETSYSLNIGVDFELLGRRLNGSVEYFRRATDDLLYNVPVPISSGIVTGSIPQNVGAILNRGIELDLTGVIYRTNDFEWNVNFNATHYTNKITKLYDAVKEEGIKQTSRILKEGGSIYEIYLRSYAGVDPETGLALYYKDATKKETTTEYENAEQIDLGSTLPKVYGGIGTTLRYKNLDFGLQMSYQIGGKIYDGTYQAFMHNGGSGMQGNNWSVDIRNAWTPENRYTNVPRLSSADDCYQLDSDRFITGADYLSFNNVTIGYTLPKKWMMACHLNSLRVYVAGDNLGVITRRQGLDPRYSLATGGSTSGSGVGSSSYSSMRTFTAGLSLSF